jgi:hypothetical protein
MLGVQDEALRTFAQMLGDWLVAAVHGRRARATNQVADARRRLRLRLLAPHHHRAAAATAADG